MGVYATFTNFVPCGPFDGLAGSYPPCSALDALQLLVGIGRVDEALGFSEGEVPGLAGDEFAAGVRLVRFDAAGAEQDVYAFAAQLLDTSAEGGSGCQG